MQGLVNAVKGTAIGVAGYLTPILKESKFRETGVITPEEFVAAGDHLVYSCPTWQWSAGEAGRTKSYLPVDKQFLVTRNVPCYKRISQVDTHREESEALVDVEGAVGFAATGEDAWVDTHHFTADAASSGPEKAREMEAEKKPAAAPAAADDNDEDAGAAMDMEQFVQSGMLDASDNAVAVAEVATEATVTADAGSNIVETRTYDLFITYDKYYQTPRLWLSGYNEKKKPLSASETYEDISQDHAKKTVTVEAFPHLNAQPSMFSVHPCRHAEVMKKIMENMSQSRTERAEAAPGGAGDGGGLGVHEYLLVFLKFMQAVIPTIEYDFTRNIRFG